ncbi:MAG: putative porin [Candidatus Kryptoniota bacterium]
MSLIFGIWAITGYAFQIEDSVAVSGGTADSLKFFSYHLLKPVCTSGLLSVSSSAAISDSEIEWSNYTYSGEIFEKLPGTFLADMSQPGNPSDLFFDGLGVEYTSFLIDGVSYRDGTTGVVNLYQIPMEFTKAVQYIDALRSPIYEFNGTGGLINLQTSLYNQSVPYSKVRHLEEPYNYLITDGVFSQNIGISSNVEVGFERQTTNGRFNNSVYDGANVRVKYRYSIDSTRQISLSEIYYRTKGGMTGGAMPYALGQDTFDQYLINLRSKTANLTYLRHHVVAAYSQVDPLDSAQFINLSFFYGYDNFIFGDVSSPDGGPYYLHNTDNKLGMVLRGSAVMFGNTLNYGADLTHLENNYNSQAVVPSLNKFSMYFDDKYRFRALVLGLFGRADVVSSKLYPAFGASFGIEESHFRAELGGNYSQHLPTLAQKFFVSQDFSGNPLLQQERHHLIQLEVSYRIPDVISLSARSFYRLIDQPIYYRTAYAGQPAYPKLSVVNLDRRVLYGFDISAGLRIWKIEADGMLNYIEEKIDQEKTSSLPRFFISGEIFYHDTLFSGHLDLKTGIRGKAMSTFSGYELYPETIVYYQSNVNLFGPFGSSDFFVTGKIGSAIVYFVWYNFTNQQYILAPVYPMLDRSIAIGVNWEFLN